jgi:hypothetical protein
LRQTNRTEPTTATDIVIAGTTGKDSGASTLKKIVFDAPM